MVVTVNLLCCRSLDLWIAAFGAVWSAGHNRGIRANNGARSLRLLALSVSDVLHLALRRGSSQTVHHRLFSSLLLLLLLLLLLMWMMMMMMMMTMLCRVVNAKSVHKSDDILLKEAYKPHYGYVTDFLVIYAQ